jgi:hypothetical protein
MGMLQKSLSFRIRMRTKHPIAWPLLMGFLFLGFVVASGISGYMFLLGWNFVESFYMFVITLSTVGYTEVRPLTSQGRIMTAFIILGGVGSFAYLVGSFTQMVVEGKFNKAFGRRVGHLLPFSGVRVGDMQVLRSGHSASHGQYVVIDPQCVDLSRSTRWPAYARSLVISKTFFRIRDCITARLESPSPSPPPAPTGRNRLCRPVRMRTRPGS